MTDPRAVADWLTQLADPVRLRLVARLLGGAASVEDLAVTVGVVRTSLKFHLKAIRRHGLAGCERVGRYVLYSLACRVTRRRGRVTLHGPGVSATFDTSRGEG